MLQVRHQQGGIGPDKGGAGGWKLLQVSACIPSTTWRDGAPTSSAPLDRSHTPREGPLRLVVSCLAGSSAVGPRAYRVGPGELLGIQPWPRQRSWLKAGHLSLDMGINIDISTFQLTYSRPVPSQWRRPSTLHVADRTLFYARLEAYTEPQAVRLVMSIMPEDNRDLGAESFVWSIKSFAENFPVNLNLLRALSANRRPSC